MFARDAALGCLLDRVQCAYGRAARRSDRGVEVRAAIKKRSARVRACRPARGGYAFALQLTGPAVHVDGDEPKCLRAIVDEVIAGLPHPGDGAQLPLRPIRFWVH